LRGVVSGLTAVRLLKREAVMQKNT